MTTTSFVRSLLSDEPVGSETLTSAVPTGRFQGKYRSLTDTKLWLVLEEEHPVASCVIWLGRRSFGRSVINISSAILALVSSYN